MPDPIADLGITCPTSSKFYVCDNQVSRFLGCCTSDPCSTADGKCPDTNIEATFFDPAKGSLIPPQSCAPANDDSTTTAMWYTCPDSEHTFMGCCTVDACSSTGCPVGSVTAARLSDRADDAVVFLPDTMSSASPTSTGSPGPNADRVTTPTAPTTTITATVTIDAADASGPSDGEMSTSATIAVGVTATMIGLGIIGLLFYWVLRRLRIASQDDDVPDFPHDKPDFDDPAENSTPSSSSSIIELQNLYAELESQKVRIHEAHLQAQAQEEAQAQAQAQAQAEAEAQAHSVGTPMPEMPGRLVLAKGDYKH